MGMVVANWRSTKIRKALGDRVVPVIGTPVSQLLVRSPRPDHYFDPAEPALRSRLRRLVKEADVDGDTLVPMATLYRAHGGGPLRTMTGGLPFENGRTPSRKSPFALDWEGEAQRALVIRSESDHDVVRIGAESIGLSFPSEGEIVEYTGDVETEAPDGTITVTEVKRDEDDLADPAYCRKLAMVAEILRRCDIRFRVMFRDEIFVDRIHRANAELFAARSFATVRTHHFDRLARHVSAEGRNGTYGALAEALEPGHSNAGRAIVQALTVRRRVQIDLTRRLTSATPLIIH